MAEQGIAPIEIKPGTRFEADLARERWAWMQRVLLPPFEKHLAQWPAQADAARSFVKQALMARAGHPDVDPKRPWEVMEQEGAALINARVDDPLVCWLAGMAAWESREGFTEARECISKAFRHKLLGDYPSVLILYLTDLKEETRRKNKSPESVVKVNIERRKQIIKSAADPAVYIPEDDRLLYSDVEFIFGTVDLTDVSAEAAELEQFCETPHFSPWLREMLHGKLSSSRRNGDEHQVKARAHFLKAWALCPDRAAAASAMIEIVKSGNGMPGDSARLWFDRAIAVEFDHFPAYSNYLQSLRTRRGGSIEKIQAFYCACALTERHDDTALASAIERLNDNLGTEAADLRTVISKPPIRQAVVNTCRALAESKNVYRIWEHSWRLADLGLMACLAGEYQTAYETLLQVPAPFPRQTRRKLEQLFDVSNEITVRAHSAIFAAGLQDDWEAAEELYNSHRVAEASQSYQDLVARFQGEPPGLLLERIAACKFETSFATGNWVSIWADPDLAEWHRCSGSWTGLKSGTLVNKGMDAQAFILHNGRTGSNFELMGEYEVKNLDNNAQGFSIMLGYHVLPGRENYHWEDFIACTQWQSSSSIAVASMLRMISLSDAPQVTPPINGTTWKFHILCRNGAVTFRLNHGDIVVNHHVTNSLGTFEMAEDTLFGLCHHFLDAKSQTNIRRLKIRRLEPPAEAGHKERKPVSLSELQASFKAACQSTLADLNAAALIEAEVQSEELQRVNKDQEAGKMRAFIAQLKNSDVVKPEDMPVSVGGEETLATLQRGYQASLSSRLASVRAEWKTKALALRDAAQNSQEAADVMLYVSAELEESQSSRAEEPLAAQNAFKWTPLEGQWTRTAEQLSAGGRSSMLYEFNRRPPFQLDFDINALQSRRPQLILGNVKFADEGTKTFGLYPQPGAARLFNYQPNTLYHVTLKATLEKTELLINGNHFCDGARVEGNVSRLRFLSGNGASSGRTEFHNIRISPLP